MELAFLHTSKVRDRRRYKDYCYQITLYSSVSQNDQYLISTYEMIDVRKYLVWFMPAVVTVTIFVQS